MRPRSSTSSGIAFLDRPAAIAEVRSAVARLAARRSDVREAFLFGSLARGDATARSDADILIVVEDDPRRPMDRIPEFLELLDGIDRGVDVVVLTTGEWRARAGTRFRREVATRGLRLIPAAVDG